MDKEIECQTKGWEQGIADCLSSIVGAALRCGMPEHLLRRYFERALIDPHWSVLPPKMADEASRIAPKILKGD